MKITLTNEVVGITVDANIYTSDVLHKCFYWYGGEFIVDIEKTENNKHLITLKSKNDKQFESDWEAFCGKIKTDLIDFKLRDVVTKETINVRDLLIAKAFSNYDSLENPVSEISDPVGFTPL